MKIPALVALLSVMGGCRGDASLEEGRAAQREVRRAIITSKSLGRFGTFALLQEDLPSMPCQRPVSPQNPTCVVQVVGQGRVELLAAPADLLASGRLPPNVPVAIRYQADCARRSFDFKTFDQVLPRLHTSAMETIWGDHLVRVTWAKDADGGAETCTVSLEAAPALLSRLGAR